MSRTKDLFIQQREFEDSQSNMLDADYQYELWLEEEQRLIWLTGLIAIDDLIKLSN